MTKLFRPMLASPADMSLLRFPLLVSPKLDGVRALCIDGKPMSRSMKVIPNLHIQRLFAENAALLEGLDGELICGAPHAEHAGDDVFNRTVGNVMRHEGEPEFTFWVFDLLSSYKSFENRFVGLKALHAAGRYPSWVSVVQHLNAHHAAELENLEATIVDLGYEGMMLRDPSGPYKQGRSTAREGWLLKIKRIADAEAIIVGFEEEMENTNEATRNELGRTKRSSAAEGLVGKGRLGAFKMLGAEGQPFEGKTFNIGTGIDHATREDFWARQNELLGQSVTYKYLPVGSIDAPRHPVFKAVRNPVDIL